jgi:hypothetical protein
MARGRKKGGYDINSLSDKNDIIDKIINQTNSLNKKIKSFKNEGIQEQSEYMNKLLTNDMVKYNKTGTISKSKNFYSDKGELWLKKTLATLHKLNNHEFYGTTTKYKKKVTESVKKIHAYTIKTFKDKGYNEEFIRDLIHDPSFFDKVFNAFSEQGQGFGSNQEIEKVLLSYGDITGLENSEMNRILNNIEYAKRTEQSIDEKQKLIDEIFGERNGAKR